MTTSATTPKSIAESNEPKHLPPRGTKTHKERAAPFRAVTRLLVAVTGLAFATSLPAQTLYVPGGTVGTSGSSGVGIGTNPPVADSLHIAYSGDVRLILWPNTGANNRESLLDFYSTFDNYPTDTGTRRTATIRAGYDGGVWGTEYLSFHVGGSDNAQAHPIEVMRLQTVNGGSLKIRVPSGFYSNTMGLQVGAPIESVVNDADSFIRFHDPGNRWYSLGYKVSDQTLRLNYGSYPGELSDFVMDYLGRVGLGTTNPGSQLDVLSPDFAVSRFFGSTSGNHAILVSNSVADLNIGVGSQPATNGVGYLYSSSNKVMIGSDGAPTLIVDGMSNGKVGIGTTSPTHTLSVNGAIKAKEVIVETNWSDYVFAKDYRLAPLSEVEVHIKAAGHLPGIPSAAEVAKRGVSVGEMQARLLAKIEELTLHLIELEKENVRLRSRVENLEAADR